MINKIFNDAEGNFVITQQQWKNSSHGKYVILFYIGPCTVLHQGCKRIKEIDEIKTV